MLLQYSRILVVDDSPTIRKAVRAMLMEIGYLNIDQAADGAEAEAMIGRLRYELVISDWLMSPVSGIDLLQRLRQSDHGRRLPFIMMTTQNRRKFMEVARDAGATFFLAKPFTARQLADKIALLA